METADLLLWIAIVGVYIVTLGPMIIGFRESRKKEAEKREHELIESPRSIKIPLSESDWRALNHLAQNRRRSTEDVAKQALRMGVQEMEETTTVHLSVRDAERLVEMLEDPPKPSAKYLEARERHRRMRDRATTGVQKPDR